jgi:hypothetical protein
MLVWALGSMYRRDTEACRRYLAAIPPGSSPARLIPVFEAIRGDKKSSAPLTAAANVLLGRLQGDIDMLNRRAREVDVAFDRGYKDSDIVQAIREAIAECRRTAPAHLEKLKQYVFVRASSREINIKTVNAAMGGGPSLDAAFYWTTCRAKPARPGSPFWRRLWRRAGSRPKARRRQPFICIWQSCSVMLLRGK